MHSASATPVRDGLSYCGNGSCDGNCASRIGTNGNGPVGTYGNGFFDVGARGFLGAYEKRSYDGNDSHGGGTHGSFDTFRNGPAS